LPVLFHQSFEKSQISATNLIHHVSILNVYDLAKLGGLLVPKTGRVSWYSSICGKIVVVKIRRSAKMIRNDSRGDWGTDVK